MRFSIIALVAFTGAVAAQDYKPCEGLYGNAKCCAADVANLADVDCKDVSETPTDAANFKEICAEGGQQAYCCAIPAVSDLIGLKSGCWLMKIVAGWTRCSVQAACRRLNRLQCSPSADLVIWRRNRLFICPEGPWKPWW